MAFSTGLRVPWHPAPPACHKSRPNDRLHAFAASHLRRDSVVGGFAALRARRGLAGAVERHRPERRGDPQLMDRLDHDAQVVAKHLAECFVDLPNGALAPELPAELGLDHVVGGLDIRALVVVGEELIPLVGVEAPHPLPEG
jgi:hypothetical protein